MCSEKQLFQDSFLLQDKPTLQSSIRKAKYCRNAEAKLICSAWSSANCGSNLIINTTTEGESGASVASYACNYKIKFFSCVQAAANISINKKRVTNT